MYTNMKSMEESSILKKVSDSAAGPNRAALMMWSTLACVCLFTRFVLSNGRFSYWLTLAAIVNMFSFLMLAYYISVTKSCRGLSCRMMECYVLVIIARFSSTLFYDSYTPSDNTGDSGMYSAIEALTLILVVYIIYLCRVKFNDTYDENRSDTVNIWYLVVPCLMMSLPLNPGYNEDLMTDAAWAFANYLECLAVLPQLMMFQKDKTIAEFSSHFLAAQGLARFMNSVFFIGCYRLMNYMNQDASFFMSRYVGYWFVFIHLAQLAVMGDFVVLYAKCLFKGIPVKDMNADWNTFELLV